MKPTLKDYFFLHFLIVIWGFTAILGLLIKVSPVAVTFYRTLLSAVGLGVILLLKKQFADTNARTRWQLLGVGVIMGVHWFAFFQSARVSNASVCLAGMATTSLFTALIDPFFAKTRISWVQILFGLMVVVGLGVIFGFEYERAAEGLLWALLSAFLAAFFTIFNSRFTHTNSSFNISFYEMVGAALTSGLMWIVSEQLTPSTKPLLPDWASLGWLLVLAWLCTVYAHTAGIRILKKISPFVFSLSLNMEPVYGIVFAFLIFGKSEQMTPAFYVGTVVILAAVVGYPWLQKREK